MWDRRAAHSEPVGQMPRGSDSEIFESQAGALRDPRTHAGAKFLVVVEGKHEIGPPVPRECSVRTGLALDPPPNSERGREDATSVRGGPGVHAARNETFRNSAGASA